MALFDLDQTPFEQRQEAADLRRGGHRDPALIYLKAGLGSGSYQAEMPDFAKSSRPPLNETWQSVGTAPFDQLLELAVINGRGVHALVFPCRRILGGWLKADTNKQIEVFPTHWRPWEDHRD